MTDNELLLALSDMLDAKLDAKIEPLKIDMEELKNDILKIKLDIENDIKPNIMLLAENYVPAAKKYEKAVPQIESLQADIELMKKVIAEHSQKLQMIS